MYIEFTKNKKVCDDCCITESNFKIIWIKGKIERRLCDLCATSFMKDYMCDGSTFNFVPNQNNCGNKDYWLELCYIGNEVHFVRAKLSQYNWDKQKCLNDLFERAIYLANRGKNKNE